MNFLINNFLIDIILVTFPLLVYFIYSCYTSLNNTSKYNNLCLTICLISSLYLILSHIKNEKILLFTSIPILISYIKKKQLLGLALSIYAIYKLTINSDLNIYFLILKYLSVDSFLVIIIFCTFSHLSTWF